MLLPKDGCRPPKHVRGKTAYFLHVLRMCKLLISIIRINSSNSYIFIKYTYSWNPFNYISHRFIHCIYSSSPPIHPSILPSTQPVYKYIHSVLEYINLSITCIQSSQLLHAYVVRRTKVLFVLSASRVFWFTFLYLSLFLVHTFRIFLRVVLFLSLLSCPSSSSFLPQFYF
jgi:hypothetical protein